MSKAREKQEAAVERLRRQLADAEALAGNLRARLDKAEAKLTGETPQQTGLDLLWDAAPPMARTRSSKFKCRAAWNRIPLSDRPRISVLIDALKIWARCQEWRKDDGQFVPALDRFIRDRRWESLPECSRNDVAARYRTTRKPLPAPTGDEITDPAEIARLLSVHPQRMRS